MERTTALWAVYGHFWQRNSRQGFEFNHSIKSVCVTLDAPLFDCYFELRCSVYVFDAVSFVFIWPKALISVKLLQKMLSKDICDKKNEPFIILQ